LEVVNAEIVQHGSRCIGKKLLRDFELRRECTKWSGECVATSRKVEWGRKST